MAAKDSDNPNYKNPDSYLAHFKKAAKGDAKNWKTPIASYGAFTVLPSVILGSFLTMMTTMGPELPAEDPDTYTGLFNQHQRYSFYTPGPSYNQYGGSVFLMQNEVGYGVYKASEHDHERLLFVSDEQEALRYIDRVQIRLQHELQELRDASLSPFSEDRTNISTCSYVSAPFEHGGGVERFVSDYFSRDCRQVSGTASERIDAYEQALQQWNAAEASIRSGEVAYGYNPDDLVEPRLVTKFEHLMNNILLFSAGMGGVLFGGTAVSAANSRRKSLKEKKQSPK